MNTGVPYHRFTDRHEAGRELAEELLDYREDAPVILALPRGGVVVGFEVARLLSAQLDALCAKKLGAPTNPEFAIGAISENGVVILDEPTVQMLSIPEKKLALQIAAKQEELKRQVELYRGERILSYVQGRLVILVDDGLATGMTAQAAIEAVEELHASEIVFAAPVCAYETAETLRTKVDAIVCPVTPYSLRAIGLYYEDFHQVSDDEVVQLLQRAKGWRQGGVYYAQ